MTENKIEQYLINLMYTYREVESNLWLLEDPEHSLEGVVVIYSDPLVIIRAQVMDVPASSEERKLELYGKLLELNANDLVHGAYGVEPIPGGSGKIVLIDTLEYDTMDFTEFRASLDAFSLALTQHYPILSVYRGK
jgi:hypothetical protein